MTNDVTVSLPSPPKRKRSKRKKPKIEYLYKTTLKKRGWTDDLIRRFLRRPSKRVINMHYKSGPRASIYSKPRVERAEAMITQTLGHTFHDAGT